MKLPPPTNEFELLLRIRKLVQKKAKRPAVYAYRVIGKRRVGFTHLKQVIPKFADNTRYTSKDFDTLPQDLRKKCIDEAIYLAQQAML